MGKKKKAEEKTKGGRAVAPEPSKPKGRSYICICGHEDPRPGGFKKYKAGTIETFEKAPPAAFWRPQDEIKETEV